MISPALAQWFGGNRLLAHHVGEALEGCEWVGVIFAGGMAELPYIEARTILVNDLHRHVINLARVVADDTLRPQLLRQLRRKALHPDELKRAQERCQDRDQNETEWPSPSLPWAEDYFVCSWMGRNGLGGIDDEFYGLPSIRWNATGGDSAVRYYGAIKMLAVFSRTLRRCTFETMDCFDFLAKCQDKPGHGLYADPPFVGAGRRYKHNPGQDDGTEKAWHVRLRDALENFEQARVVVRMYEHPLVRELYSDQKWEYRHLKGGKKQSNEAAPELLLVKQPKEAPGLFAQQEE